MANPNVSNRGAHCRGGITVVLAATLVALLAVFILAKPSGAQVVDPAVTLTVDPVEVGFGAVLVDGSVATRTITVTNNSSAPITIGGVKLTGDAGEILDFSTNIDPATGLTIAGGGTTGTFTVSFDPSVEGTRDATLTLLEGLLDGAVLTLTGETIKLIDTAGNTVTGINLSGTGSQTDPFTQPGAQGCTIVGTPQGETLTGTRARDIICGLGGADKINGLRNNDLLKGGSGNDRITDKKGKDRLFGQGGRDRLNAKDGQRGDVLKGGGGKDRAAKDKGDRARGI
jgi:Ca2+-binding RTX toxin-like protein